VSFDFDAVVVGAGAVGLACGHALAGRGQAVLVLESQNAIGQGVSSRNSEVIHAGLYYPTGSLKARLCVEGRRALYPFLEARGIAHDRCGKLVVATEDGERGAVETIAVQAEANDVEGCRLLDRGETLAMEPLLNAVMALLSPESGIFDSHGYMLALQAGIEDAGGLVQLEAPFEGADVLAGGGWSVRGGGAEVTAGRLVTAPGLGAQGVAALIDGFPAERIPRAHYGKGCYFSLSGRAPFSRLIYPPPIPGALGTHYRRDLSGRAVFGPDLEYVDIEDYRVDEGRAESFYDYIRRFWPGLPDGALSPDYAGIRPKLHGSGEPQPDFVIDGPAEHRLEGLVCLFGIESPGLTSSLAIGEAVAKALDA
jgi:L-2-hydroxyglutarate oxidase LhgO